MQKYLVCLSLSEIKYWRKFPINYRRDLVLTKLCHPALDHLIFSTLHTEIETLGTLGFSLELSLKIPPMKLAVVFGHPSGLILKSVQSVSEAEGKNRQSVLVLVCVLNGRQSSIIFIP